MKKLTVFLIFHFIATILFSQTIEWMPTLHQSAKKESTPFIIKSTDKYVITYSLHDCAWFTYYAYADVSTSIRFDKYDTKTGELIASKTHFYQKDRYAFEHVFVRDNEIIAFVHYYKGNEVKYYTRILTYDAETFELKKNENFIERKVFSAAYGRYLDYNISADKNHILISQQLIKINYLKYSIMMYDKNWTLKFRDTIPEDNFIQVDNEGSFYYINRGDKNSDNSIVSHDVYKDYEKWEEKIDVSFLDKNEKITNVLSAINKDGDYIISGLYGKDDGKLKGYFFLKVNKTSKEVAVNKKVEFSNIASLNPSCLEFLKKLDRYDLTSRIVTSSDAGVVVCYEVKKPLTNTEFNNAFLMKLDSKGNPEWLVPIEKKQTYGVAILSHLITINSFSYKLIEHKNKIFFFFYSGVSKNKAKPEPFTDDSKGQLNVYVIDIKSGDIKKSMIDQDKKGYVYLSSMFNNDGDLYFIKKFRKQFQFGKLRLEE